MEENGTSLDFKLELLKHIDTMSCKDDMEKRRRLVHQFPHSKGGICGDRATLSSFNLNCCFRLKGKLIGDPKWSQ